MKDRISTEILPNGAIRYGIYNADGTLNRYEYIKPEDEPTQEGDALNKANLLPNSIASALKLTGNPQVKDALAALLVGPGRYGFAFTVMFSTGVPAAGIAINGVTAVDGGVCVTGSDGSTLGISTQPSVTVSISNANIVDIVSGYSATVVATSAVTFVPTITLRVQSTPQLIINSGRVVRFSSAVDTVDVCLIGAGGGGHAYEHGGGGGYINNIMNKAVEAMSEYTVVIGAAGLGGDAGGGTDGGVSSIAGPNTSSTAPGGKGGRSVMSTYSQAQGNGAGANEVYNATSGSGSVFNEGTIPVGGGGASGRGDTSKQIGGNPSGGNSIREGSGLPARGLGGGGGGGSSGYTTGGSGSTGQARIRWRYKSV